MDREGEKDTAGLEQTRSHTPPQSRPGLCQANGNYGILQIERLPQTEDDNIKVKGVLRMYLRQQ